MKEKNNIRQDKEIERSFGGFELERFKKEEKRTRLIIWIEGNSRE